MTTLPETIPTMLSIPGELRNIIWGVVLQSASPIPIISPICVPSIDNKSAAPALYTAPEPAVALTCNALRNEILSTYYSINTFTIPRIALHDEHLPHSQSRYLQAMRRWRDMPGTIFTARLDMGLVLNVQRSMVPYRVAEYAFTWIGRVVEGRIEVRLTDGLKDYCVCDFERFCDGTLSDAAIEVVEMYWPDVRETLCDDCWRLKLV